MLHPPSSTTLTSRGVELPGCVATALVGEVVDLSSAARRETDHMGAERQIHAERDHPARTQVRTRSDPPEWRGSTVDGTVVTPGHLAYLGVGRDECELEQIEDTRAVLIGGVEFTEPLLMWWNFVARTDEEITAAYRDWTARSERFGPVASPLAVIDTDPPPWSGR